MDFSHVKFDPNDPDQVKVHYDVSGWSFDHRAELAEVLAEMQVPHTWEEDELVVPEEVEEPIDLVFVALEQELGPFPVPLEDGTSEVVYELDEWPARDVAEITARLVADGVPHRWEERTLIVGPESEELIDGLLDELELAAEVGLPASPTRALGEFFKSGKQLAKNPLHPKARKTLYATLKSVDGLGPPEGLEMADWEPMVVAARELRDEFEADDPDVERIQEQAEALAERAHQWV